MKPSNLHDVWSAPDNSRLTPKQLSFRLPVHVAAKLAALGDMYPHRTRTQIVGDLLSAALEQVESGFPFVQGRFVFTEPETNTDLYEDAGPGKRFRDLTNKHYVALERELGNESPTAFYPSDALVGDVKKE
jgi:hypothetical protein